MPNVTSSAHSAPPNKPTVAEPPAIRVAHLSQRYGRVTVLHDVSFEVGAGEIFGFIGPNGAGKTTTIRTIATLLEPYQGRVEVGGIDVAADPESVRSIIGYMPDHAGVYERITVREYLEFFAQANGVEKATIIDAVVELTDIHNITQRLVASLSKGMRQRLQLARVLLHDPQILVLDEPASDLDPRARIEIRDLLLELRELGKTIFLSSHILSELSDVCTSVGIIEQGRLLVAGPIAEIADRLTDAQQRQGGPGRAVSEPVLPPSGSEIPNALTPQSESGETQALTPLAAPKETTPGGVVIPESAQHKLKIRVIGDVFRVRPLLEACPAIRQIETLSSGQLMIRYVGDDQFVAELVRYLVSYGVLLVGIEPEQNELERIFLEVTQGRLQ